MTQHSVTFRQASVRFLWLFDFPQYNIWSLFLVEWLDMGNNQVGKHSHPSIITCILFNDSPFFSHKIVGSGKILSGHKIYGCWTAAFTWLTWRDSKLEQLY